MRALQLIDTIGMPDKDAQDFEKINKGIEHLANLRVDTISGFEEPYSKSKLARNAAVYSNAMIYRFVSLAEGLAISWNNYNTLCAILCGRALIETVALYYQFSERFLDAVALGDFDKVHRQTMSYLMATRDEELLADYPGIKAPHVHSAIDAIDKSVIPHFRSYYDSLSERCHPNSAGHRAFFSTIDHESITTNFRNLGRDHKYLVHFRCALGTEQLMRLTYLQIKRDILTLANKHHAVFPSPLNSDRDEDTHNQE